MLIYWHGHSEFLLESADGYRVLTDPFDAHVGYPMHTTSADAVTVSHAHGDHSYTDKVNGHPMILSSEGTTRLSPTVTVQSVTAPHDGEGGQKRGMTLLTVITMDGLRIAHLGDLGCALNDTQQAFLRDTDILMIPVGGFYTIDGESAADIVQRLSPRIVIPMHFKTKYNHDWPISDEEPFFRALGLPRPEPLPLLRVTREDLSCQPQCCMFQIV